MTDEGDLPRFHLSGEQLQPFKILQQMGQLALGVDVAFGIASAIHFVDQLLDGFSRAAGHSRHDDAIQEGVAVVEHDDQASTRFQDTINFPDGAWRVRGMVKDAHGARYVERTVREGKFFRVGHEELPL